MLDTAMNFKLPWVEKYLFLHNEHTSKMHDSGVSSGVAHSANAPPLGYFLNRVMLFSTSFVLIFELTLIHVIYIMYVSHAL